MSPICPGTCLYDVPVVSLFGGFATNPSFFEDIFGCDAVSPRSILRTKPTLQSTGLVLSHSGNDRYRNIRKDHLTHWGCRATTPAVGLTPGRRSNGLPKQSRSALFALSARFSPAERFSLVSEWSRKFCNLGQFEKILCELPETQPSLQGTRFA